VFEESPDEACDVALKQRTPSVAATRVLAHVAARVRADLAQSANAHGGVDMRW